MLFFTADLITAYSLLEHADAAVLTVNEGLAVIWILSTGVTRDSCASALYPALVGFSFFGWKVLHVVLFGHDCGTCVAYLVAQMEGNYMATQ